MGTIHAGNRSLPRDVKVLIAARAINRLGAFSLPFLSLVLTSELHASLPTVGLILAAFGIASMASRLLGGWLADTLGRRTTMVLGLGGCGVAQLAIASSYSVEAVTLSVVGLGLAYEIYEPPCQAFIADSVSGAGRAAAFGLLSASLTAAALCAGLGAAALAPLSLRLLFVADAASCLAAGAFVLALLPHDAPRPRPGRNHSSTPPPWRSPLLVVLFTANVVFAASYLQVGVTLPLTLHHRGVAGYGYGVVLVTASLVVLAAQPLLRLRRRRTPGAHDRAGPGSSHLPSIIAGDLLLCCGLAGYGMAHSLAGFVVATAVGGVGEVLLAGHVLALVSSLAPAERRGRYLAAFGLSWGVAATLGPVPATLLLEHAGDRALWAAAAGCCAVVATTHAVALRLFDVRAMD